MAKRRVNGEGTIYLRKDGRYEGAAFVLTASGGSKRIRIYGKTRAEVHKKLVAAMNKSQQGLPAPDSALQLANFLDHWLEQVIRPNRRPTTHRGYEEIVRSFLKPELGAKRLDTLSVSMVQEFLNRQLTCGHSVRRVHAIREVLSSALSCAMREEKVLRNVARLVQLPTYERKEITPWTPDEAIQFLEASKNDPLHAAFLVLLCYGLRKGEVLGLQWEDIDLGEGVVKIRQQLQQVKGQFYIGPVKTKTGRRDLPLLEVVAKTLEDRLAQQALQRQAAGDWWQGGASRSGLIFTTASGRPIEPRNFNRSFDRLCKQHGIRHIKVHHARHTVATLLKNLGVPDRDIQLILGHSNISTTQQIYQHGDMSGRRVALEQVESLLSRGTGSIEGPASTAASNRQRYRQPLPSALPFLHQDAFSISGADSGTRTQDLLFTKLTNDGLRECVADMASAFHASWQQWLVGLVAVRTAVKPHEIRRRFILAVGREVLAHVVERQ